MKSAWLIEFKNTLPVLYYMNRSGSDGSYKFTTNANAALQFVSKAAAQKHIKVTGIDNMLICAEHGFED